MLFKFVIIFLSLKIVNSKIIIDLKTGVNASDVSIEYSGNDVTLITDQDIDLFGIDGKNLKEAVKKHYNGTNPKNVYLKSPTPWGDLYTKYNWEQVKRILSIKSARIKGITKKPVMVLSQDFENSFNNTIKVNAAISQTVENTVTTSWSRSNDITASQEIEYDVNIMLAKFGGSTSLSYTASWGKSEEKSETVTIGTTSAVETELKPGQAATAVLTASKGFMEIEVVYMATLKGTVAVNFKKPYKEHHFWGPSIRKVLKSGGITNEVLTTEIIKIGFYSDASLKVYDKVSGKVLI